MNEQCRQYEEISSFVAGYQFKANQWVLGNKLHEIPLEINSTYLRSTILRPRNSPERYQPNHFPGGLVRALHEFEQDAISFAGLV